MGEIDHADDAVDHRVADGDQAVDRAERYSDDELLDEIFHASDPLPAKTLKTLSARPESPNPAQRLQFLVLSRGAPGGQRGGRAFAQPVAGSRYRLPAP